MENKTLKFGLGQYNKPTPKKLRRLGRWLFIGIYIDHQRNYGR
jgi:hypothetical protein